jgi:phosphoribosyl 1,2-cyclic phosphate phosphodiesterase
MGVPTLGCTCKVCTSSDPHDRRMRPSALIRWSDVRGETAPETALERAVVIDTGPDFRAQALSAGLRRVDAVFYTHAHADHIMGLDDLRPLSFAAMREGGPIPLYASEESARVMRHVFDYTFSPQAIYPMRARVKLEPLSERTDVRGVEFVRVPVMHGEMQIEGFRFGNAAYLTDVSEIPESSFALLEGLEHLVVSALRHKPHPNHATVEQAVGWARRIGARHTWLTHIAHELGHEETNAALPEGIRLAHDGLTVAVSLKAASVNSASGGQ